MRLSGKLVTIVGALALLASFAGSTAASGKAKKPRAGSSCSHPWKLTWKRTQGFGSFSDSGQHIRFTAVRKQGSVDPTQWHIETRWYGLRHAVICFIEYRWDDGEVDKFPGAGRDNLVDSGPVHIVSAVVTAKGPPSRKKR